jgi:hypothetical protein
MRKLVNLITIFILIAALGAIVYGFVLSKHTVYDKPDSRDNGKLSTCNILNESQLLNEMNYDAITRDIQGNLINKGRAAACLT